MADRSIYAEQGTEQDQAEERQACRGVGGAAEDP